VNITTIYGVLISLKMLKKVNIEPCVFLWTGHLFDTQWTIPFTWLLASDHV